MAYKNQSSFFYDGNYSTARLQRYTQLAFIMYGTHVGSGPYHAGRALIPEKAIALQHDDEEPDFEADTNDQHDDHDDTGDHHGASNVGLVARLRLIR